MTIRGGVPLGPFRLTLTLLAALAVVPAAPAVSQQRPLASLVGRAGPYTAQPGDTFASLGARFGVEAFTLASRNQMQPTAALTPGDVLMLDNRHIVAEVDGARVVINVPQRMLFLTEMDRVLAYPIAAGRNDWPTPTGSFTVVERELNPVWDVPLSIQAEMRREGRPVIQRIAPGPDNPLGAHWIRLSLPGIGIHGTIAPLSIYSFASHGCIRMHPADVADLFARVAVGDAGAVVYEPVLAAVQEGRLFLEVHSDVYQLAPEPGAQARTMLERLAPDLVDWDAVSTVVREKAGVAIDVTRSDIGNSSVAHKEQTP